MTLSAICYTPIGSTGQIKLEDHCSWVTYGSTKEQLEVDGYNEFTTARTKEHIYNTIYAHTKIGDWKAFHIAKTMCRKCRDNVEHKREIISCSSKCNQKHFYLI